MRVYSKTDLYIKRVLREVKRSYEDTYIDTVISKEILNKINELSCGDNSGKGVALALKKLGPASELGKVYKKQYRSSAQKINAFLMFSRFFSNMSAAVLILVTAFFVFRVFPQTEYVAYGFCALSGVAAAVISYLNFYKLRYMLSTIVLPLYLLLFYPIKDALLAYRRYGEPFFKNLFSYNNHAVYLILLSSLVAFFLTISCLHAEYIFKKRSRHIVRALAVLLTIAALLGFAAYAVELKKDYDSEAALLLAEIKNDYHDYLETGKLSDELSGLSQDMQALAKRYGTIYIPSDKLVTNSFLELIRIFRIYDTGYENLVSYYHPAFNPEKDAYFDVETLDTIMETGKARAGAILSSEALDFRALINILNRCNTLRFELIYVVDVCFEEWTYDDRN